MILGAKDVAMYIHLYFSSYTHRTDKYRVIFNDKYTCTRIYHYLNRMTYGTSILVKQLKFIVIKKKYKIMKQCVMDWGDERGDKSVYSL